MEVPIWLNLPKSEAVNQCWAGTPVLGWLEQLVLVAVSKSRAEIGSDFWNWFQNQNQFEKLELFFPIPKLELSWFYLCVEPKLELNFLENCIWKK